MCDLRILSTALTIGMLIVAMPALAQGPPQSPTLIDPFGPDAAVMSKEDRTLMRQSMEKVLASKRAGSTSDWKGGGENAGRATLRKTFTRDGMSCGEVVHEFTAGPGHRYVLPFCETKGGQWKLAF